MKYGWNISSYFFPQKKIDIKGGPNQHDAQWTVYQGPFQLSAELWMDKGSRLISQRDQGNSKFVT